VSPSHLPCPIHWLGRSLALPDFRRLKLALMLPVIDCGLKPVARNFIFCVVNSCNSCHWLKPMVGDGFSERRIRSAFWRANLNQCGVLSSRCRVQCQSFSAVQKVLPFRKLPFHHSLLAIRYSLPFCHSPFAIAAVFPDMPICRPHDLPINSCPQSSELALRKSSWRR
jgi:hypothetical protein